MKKKVLFPICILLMLLCGISTPAQAAITINSSSAIVMDADTGQILYGKNPYTLAASGEFNLLLNVITALRFDNPPKELVVTKQALKIYTSAPYLGLKEGQTVKLNDMLYAVYLGGYNDAANVIAENLGQTLLDTSTAEYAAMTDQQKTAAAIDAYVKQMNLTVDELCCPTMKATNADSHFYDTQQCSPSDVARLIRNSLKNETFQKIFTTKAKNITGDASAVNNQASDYKDKQNALKEENGGKVPKGTAYSDPAWENPGAYASTETISTGTTTGKFRIATTNKLFNGEILYSGILGGSCGYNKSTEQYHAMVYAENENRKLIAVVMNGDENLIYDDLQALLNFGFYKWEPANITEKQLNHLLPDKVSALDLGFSGDEDFLMPTDYKVSDLEAAIAYSENGYLRGTITLTLPEEASYAGTVTTINFYERNERSVWDVIIKIVLIPVIAAAVFIIAYFLWRRFSAKSGKSKAYVRRMRINAEKKKAQSGSYRQNAPNAQNRSSEKDTYYAGNSHKNGHGKSENRRNYEKIKEKKEVQKRRNRNRSKKQ